MPKQKNDSNNYDFCIRKAIGVHVIGKYLRENGITEETFGLRIGFYQGTVSRWVKLNKRTMDLNEYERETEAPSFAGIIAAAAEMRMPISTMLTDAVDADEKTPIKDRLLSEKFIQKTKQYLDNISFAEKPDVKKTHVSTDTHLRNLRFFSETHFTLFCDPYPEGNNGYCTQYNIDTGQLINSGVVPFSMNGTGENKETYYGSIVAQPATRLVHLYFMQHCDFPDRGMAQFYFASEKQTEGKYLAGYGTIHMMDGAGISSYKRAVLVRTSRAETQIYIDEEDIRYICRLLNRSFTEEETPKIHVDDYEKASGELLEYLKGKFQKVEKDG